MLLFVASLETVFYYANIAEISKPKYAPILSHDLSKTVGGENVGDRDLHTGCHGHTEH